MPVNPRSQTAPGRDAPQRVISIHAARTNAGASGASPGAPPAPRRDGLSQGGCSTFTLNHAEDEAGRNDGAHLLVCSWRLVMARGVECPLVSQRFKCACGASGAEVFAAFCTFLCALALAQRRCLLVNPPGANSLTPDEIRMLTIVAAAQCDCTATLDAHLTWLARRIGRQTLAHSAHDLARLLSRHRLRLPMPA